MVTFRMPGLADAYNRRKADQQVRAPAGRRVDPERVRLMQEARKIPRVRVEATSEEMRRVLKHPSGLALRSGGSVEWPLDKFTQRRLREGAIRIVEQAEGRQARHAAHARSSKSE